MALKPVFQITNDITKAITSIERARGFLEGATLSPDWVRDMQDHAFVLEAHHTTHIEGTQLTFNQSKQILAGQVIENTNKEDVKELLNYQKAFEMLACCLDSGDAITESLIREIHKTLVLGVRGNSAAPGEYRKIQNYVVNQKTGKPVYTPPPAYEVPIMIAELVQWINTENQINPILIAGIAQFQFVHIHPFLDGNGRVGRLLSTLCLYQKGYDFKRLFTISEYYDRNRADYYQAIQSVRDKKMDMTDWLLYFTQGLAFQMQSVHQSAQHNLQLEALQKAHHLSERQQSLIAYMLAHPTTTIQDFEKIFPTINRRTVQRELKTLIALGVVESKGATNNLIYKLATN